MRPNRLSSAPRLSLATLLAALAGCSGYVAVPGYGPPVYGEFEPNDSPASADFLGYLDSTSHFFVEGHVQSIGYDTCDYFLLEADEPIGIQFYLSGADPFDDLDLSLIDPHSGQVIAIYDAPWNPEDGYFTLDWPGTQVILLVESWVFDADYSLEILAGPHPYGSGGGPGSGFIGEQATGALQAHRSGISFPTGAPTPDASKGRPAPEPLPERPSSPAPGAASGPQASRPIEGSEVEI